MMAQSPGGIRSASVAFDKYTDLLGGERAAGVSPFEGPRLLIVGFDEIQESLHEFLSRFEDSAADDLAGQNAEPNFDLVKPTGMGRSEIEVKPFLFRDPGQSLLAPMGGTVVGDDVKFLTRIGSEQPAQETDEGRAVVAPDGFSVDSSTMDFERSQQRGSPMALVFVAKSFDPMRFHGQSGLR